MLKLIECPRDAMQGLHDFIPTAFKAEYINMLLQVGYDTIDFGSFVSPKIIPQLRDTSEVLKKLDLGSTKTKLLAIVANKRGAIEASSFEEITYLGYPYSISETFQLRNTNSTIQESLAIVADLQEICQQKNKKLVVYISMAFGNPYGDECNLTILHQNIEALYKLGVEIMPLSDILGNATSTIISEAYKSIIPTYPNIEFGLHLHTRLDDYCAKVDAAYQANCRRFDMVINGYGGCPRTGKGLIGNLNTFSFINYVNQNNLVLNLDVEALKKAQEYAQKIFP